MKKRIGRFTVIMLAVVCAAAIPGCGKKATLETETEQRFETEVTTETEKVTETETVNETEAATETEPIIETETETETDSILTASSMDEIRAELETAIADIRQPRPMEVSAVVFSEHPELDVKNLYYNILSVNRAYCYAYNLEAVVSDGMLTTAISYMPYVTGDFPEGFEGEEVSTLTELLTVAEAHLGEEFINIRITNKELTSDEMGQALQQVGGAYVLCMLNNDATAVVYRPVHDFTMEECLRFLQECDTMAEMIVEECISEDMTDTEKARALYASLTEKVKYDQRYYSDKASMPYHSQTAYGALHDDLAICGGYSHALKLLLEKAGITAYNVTGVWGGEPHMWNIVCIDGEWLYFDATADRGVSEEYWRYAGVEVDALASHTLDDNAAVELLITGK